MKNALICFLLLALTVLLFLLGDREKPPTVLPPPYPTLARIFDQASVNPALSGTAVGFCLLDASGHVVFERNSLTAFIPASTLKTLTTATALEKWGPDFQIQTALMTGAELVDGVLEGDLILRGGADPMLSLAHLENWAGMLRDQGVLRIKGRIIGDGRLLKGSIYDDFWNWGDIGNGYGSGVSGLNLEHNRFRARFRPGDGVGKAATFLGVAPEVPGVRWISEVTSGAADSGDGVVIHGGEHTGVMHFRGTVPLGERDFAVNGAVPDPEAYAAHHLRTAFINAGIAVDGAAATASSLGAEMPEAPRLFFRDLSPRLIEIITSIHASSDNHETECLYRLLGEKEGRKSDDVLREHWRGRGLVFEGLRMEDGCGLARADYIRPVDLAQIQHLAGTGPHGALYRESLLATEDGTLRWKGGAMSGVRSYTGCVKGASGAGFSFALMMNHFTDSQAVSGLRDQVIEALRGL